jgi:hypothetical protein
MQPVINRPGQELLKRDAVAPDQERVRISGSQDLRISGSQDLRI